MTRSRSLARFALGLLAGCLAAAAAPAQVDLKPYRLEVKLGPNVLEQPPGDNLTMMSEMRTGNRRVAGPEQARNRAVLRQAAQIYIYKVTWDRYYTGGDTGDLRPRTGERSMDEALADLERVVLVPTFDKRLTADQRDYITEFGAAADQAFRDVMAKNPPPVIRISAARMLAIAARSGAVAHAKTITQLLTNQFFHVGNKTAETPPDVLYYALKAAEGLLAAPNPAAFGTPNPDRHSVPDNELIPLVQALIDFVEKNPPVADKVTAPRPMLAAVAPTPAEGAAPAPAPAANPAALTPEQVAVVCYYRRQAVRALARVRFDTLGGEGNLPTIRPGWTLAKVAVSDASFYPAPTVAEVGEAVIGLCGINPSSNNLDLDMLLYAIGGGTQSFMGAKDTPGAAKALPWRTYAARLAAAYDELKRGGQRNSRLRPAQAQITALAGIVSPDLLEPLLNPNSGAQTNITRLGDWVRDNVPKDFANRSMFSDAPQYKLSPRAATGP